MAILFITHKFPPSIGGMQKQSYELINGIRKYTRVYTIIQSPSEPKVMFFLKLKYRVRKMLQVHSDIETIHCNDGLMACACIWIKKEYSIPLTATFHGLDIVFPNRLFQRYLVPKLRRLDCVFAVSGATRKECIKRGFGASQVIEICNGVDHNEVKGAKRELDFLNLIQENYNINLSDKKIILSIGRSVKRKGFSWFAKNVMPQLPSDVFYFIVGPRSNSKSFFHSALRLLPESVRGQVELFLGYPSDDEELDILLNDSRFRSFHLGVLRYEQLKKLTEHAHLVVMPNVRMKGDMEGFGLVGLEANLSGAYVAAADIEGIRSAIINGYNGVMLPSQSLEAWSRCIGDLMKDSTKLSELGESAKRYVLQNYSWDKMVLQYLREFQNLVINKPLLIKKKYGEVA